MLGRNGSVANSVELILRPGSESMAGTICKRGRSWTGTERERELWKVSGELIEWDVVGAWTGRTETEGVEWGWHRELGSWFQIPCEAYRKERSVICSENDVGGRARVTRDEEQVLRGGGGGDMEVGWLWGLCKWLRGVCIRCIWLFWASKESVR